MRAHIVSWMMLRDPMPTLVQIWIASTFEFAVLGCRMERKRKLLIVDPVERTLTSLKLGLTMVLIYKTLLHGNYLLATFVAEPMVDTFAYVPRIGL